MAALDPRVIDQNIDLAVFADNGVDQPGIMVEIGEIELNGFAAYAVRRNLFFGLLVTIDIDNNDIGTGIRLCPLIA